MSTKTYQTLVERVKRQIGSPGAQSKQCVEIKRQPDDAAEDWAQLLSDLGTVENVTMIPLDDTAEHVRLRWNPEESMA
ncbi:hypothetical protein HME01_32510 [Vreelandella aquamarina]|uniref:DUF1654 domain-containing protein n=1 Tax=Vreelandella aquamarina TaxID=77097 RepID=A0A1N6CUN5_9GAMM|nr:DUF1654 domain-containing protein [Halomonas meridiana]GED47399.1 hypothetical protein HME01_32510 [Halomonas meridiana]SIN62328.1 Protein of unknown function [Halomonas meridiana]SIN72285.1 Protein of unknown function [Halomonas meridiana]SIO21289.1 Protein of unknown function [Halomonas meridiana]